MDDRRWMTRDGSQEMDHGRRMTINLLPFHEDIEVIRSYTLLEITYYDFKLRSYNRAQIRRYADTRCTAGGLVPASTMPSTTQSTIQRYRIMHLHARIPMPNTIPNQIPSQSARMPMLHIMKPYEISRQRCNDL